MISSPHLGALLTMASMLGFACMDALSKILVRSYPVAQTLWVRYGVFTLLALFLARRIGISRAARSRRPWLQTTRALLGLGENAIFVMTFYYLPLADAHAIAATSPLIVIVLAALLLRERAGRDRWLSVAAGFIGVLLIVRPGFHSFSWPLLLPLSGALLWAVYQVQTRQLAGTDASETTILWTAATGFVACTLLGPWQWQAPDAAAWALILGMAVLGSLSHYALIRALDFAPAGAVQPFAYSLLVWAALLGVVVFGDIPDRWTILGAAVVVGGGLYAWRADAIR